MSIVISFWFGNMVSASKTRHHSTGSLIHKFIIIASSIYTIYIQNSSSKALRHRRLPFGHFRSHPTEFYINIYVFPFIFCKPIHDQEFLSFVIQISNWNWKFKFLDVCFDCFWNSTYQMNHQARNTIKYDWLSDLPKALCDVTSSLSRYDLPSMSSLTMVGNCCYSMMMT